MPLSPRRANRPPRLATLSVLTFGFALVLSACGGAMPADALTIERIEAEGGPPLYRAVGAHIRGDVRIFVCGQRASLVVVVDAFDDVIAEDIRTGTLARFRVPDLGSVPRSCDVRVEQGRAGSRLERVTLRGALTYQPPSPLDGTRVLMYADISGVGADNNPRARFAAAVRMVEAVEGLDLTVVDGAPDEFLTGEVALRFADLLAGAEWDAVVFLAEDATVPTSVLEDIAAFTQGGGRALASYWLTYRPDSEYGDPARALAAAFDATVTPDDNIEPVEDGRVGIELDAPLGLGLTGPYQLINAGYYFLSYAQRLTPANGAGSLCRYTDGGGGTCAVSNAAQTTLFLGFTLAPLSESMTGPELETLFRNALRFVVLGP